MGKNRTKDFYVLFEGDRVNEPTIFTSWAAIHPYVTGCAAHHEAYFELKDARAALIKIKGTSREISTVPVKGTAPAKGDGHSNYYAVANGTKVGIYNCFNGQGGAKEQISGVPNFCYKRLPTKEQAEAFIEDWKHSVADIYRNEIKKELDRRAMTPRALNLNVALLFGPSSSPVKKEEQDTDDDDDDPEAEALLEKGKTSVADMYHRAIKRQLDKGARPSNMEFKVEGLFLQDQGANSVDALRFGGLSIS